MRSRFRALLAAGACLAVMGGLATFASANTELVPGSRLVVPYYDTTGASRTTWLFVINASPTIPLPAVHLEFYDASCIRQNTNISLSVNDIDMFDMSTIPFDQGWVDIDTRASTATTAQSIQWNQILGTVIVSDFTAGYAFAYPMASYQGMSGVSAAPCAAPGTVGCPIASRTGAGVATGWPAPAVAGVGRYEPSPWELFVPGFIAEGGANGYQAWLALAGPADGNWDGTGNGEAPGQEIGVAPAAALLKLTANLYDGCEHPASRNFSRHWVFVRFNDLTTLNIPAQPWNAANATCSAAFPQSDEFSGQPVGWLDIFNTEVSCDNNTPAVAIPGHCTAYAAGVVLPAFFQAGVGVGQRRGMVGLMLENTTLLAANQGDATRLWGNPRPWGLACGVAPGFPTVAMGAVGGVGCFYSLADQVVHTELPLP